MWARTLNGCQPTIANLNCGIALVIMTDFIVGISSPSSHVIRLAEETGHEELKKTGCGTGF